MKILVKPHELELLDEEITNEKESKVSDFVFEFDEAITDDFIKHAYFTKKDKSYKIIIENNRCDYPPEVLETKGNIEIGVVAEKVDGDTIIRYNPIPLNKFIKDGSLKDHAENSEPITPSEMEQYEQRLTDSIGEINDALADLQEKVDSGYFDGDSGIAVFRIDERGHLIARAESTKTMTKYKIQNGHLILEV